MALELLVTRAADGTTPDWQFYNLAIVMTVLAGVFVILRESIRLHQHRSLNSEDWFILIALLFDIVATVFDCLCQSYLRGSKDYTDIFSSCPGWHGTPQRLGIQITTDYDQQVLLLRNFALQIRYWIYEAINLDSLL